MSTIELPAPEVILARLAELRKEQDALRRLLRLARAAEEAERAHRDSRDQQPPIGRSRNRGVASARR